MPLPLCARALLAASLPVVIAIGAFACDNGTFPNALNVFDADGGPVVELDSSLPGDAAASDGQVQAQDGGDAAVAKDAGGGSDAAHLDAGDAGGGSDSGDSGEDTDGGSELDAADASG